MDTNMTYDVRFWKMDIYTALRKWGFNTKQRAEAPDDNAAILKFSGNTRPVSALADPATARAMLTAAETLIDGKRHDHRQLKARAPGEWRTVPIAPPLVRLLREHLDQFGNGRGGLLFTGIYGGELSSATYRRVWDRARQSALTSAEYGSPLANRIYDPWRATAEYLLTA